MKAVLFYESADDVRVKAPPHSRPTAPGFRSSPPAGRSS
jgi:hypothetical protein